MTKSAPSVPTEASTNKEIEAFAADNGISLKGATNKAQRLAIIQEAMNGD